MHLVARLAHRLGKFSVRLFLLYLAGLILTVAIILGTVSVQYRRAYVRMASQYGEGVLTRLGSDIDGYLQNLVSTSNLVLYYPSLLRYVKTSFPSPYEEQRLLNMSNLPELDGFISQLSNLSGDVQGVYLFCENGRMLYYASEIPGEPLVELLEDRAYQRADWYAQALDAGGKSVVIRQADGFPKREQGFFIAKLIRDISSGRAIGGLLIEVNATQLGRLCSAYASAGQEEYFAILDEAGMLRYCDGGRPLAKLLENGEAEAAGVGDNVFHCGGREYFASWYQTPGYGWKTIRLVPMSIAVQAQKNAVLITLAVALGSVLVSFLAFLLISRRLAKPIGELQEGMRQVEQGDFSVRLNAAVQDEIHALFLSFNRMAAQLERLVQEVYVEEMQKREAQLFALQQQINPHFLYNTLDSIQLMAVMQKDFKVSRMITMLANMFRYTISNHFEQVMLKDELEYIESYVALQQIRYENAFALQVDVPDTMLPLTILKLSVQPVVENCIYHGLRDQTGGRITIEARQLENGFLISVSDNGCGMDKETQKLLRDSMESPGEKGSLGLGNVQNRLKTAYGAQSGLLIESAPGKGTRVTLRFVKGDG
ncbi:cache domain-containing sensor histidine kinase [Harryflintia acetispora]|uniref:Histidine kinase/DNA gyrase B/HSP90-like ATPase n=1 Tax=Harryflintia acetispora TaxID=1849041 RepID=A0A9X8UKL1_9FIRM|nr:sensor histidine kinase [Harryflintia acetispora]TCL44190.1 histidine kinase/DNA gyrase B/HSP90-like ATPase [Harryflintia acetispora]